MNSLYLASQSPRRRELLTQIGVQYQMVSVDVPEQREACESPSDYVCRLALQKARAGFQALQSRRLCSSEELAKAVVLGADTLGVLGDEVFEKPLDHNHARQMLRQLSGASHQILSAVALVSGERHALRLVTTQVNFRELSDEEIDAYWASGEPCDKAGAYGIQGLGAVFVKSIEGSYSGVVGLPLTETAELLKDFCVPVWQAQD
ncbi:MAG: nucleoside triphosphate pyrophosphatase [Candidatus Pelagadaptatus aseana]|uniref:Maf family protein n=1 Tax=Candidatus Pelagadaptatus aseana TaxID=3120508 RepID=UPI0039B1CB26